MRSSEKHQASIFKGVVAGTAAAALLMAGSSSLYE